MIHLGDCNEVLKTLPDNSVDSIVTDPPAGIGFMGKSWDSDKGGRDSWIAWIQDIFTESLRVLKPGGHALVWALPRTSHWTAFALENAGFEIRNICHHVFGSGFPKSLNVSKAIDEEMFNRWLKANPEQAEKYAEQLKQALASGNHDAVFHVKRKFKRMANLERQVVGKSNTFRPISGLKGYLETSTFRQSSQMENITSPASPEAKQWDGWGTDLKPATEHWILCRKPISEKSIALNVLKHGTGGLNVKACGIAINQESETDNRILTGINNVARGKNNPNGINFKADSNGQPMYKEGRFPSNLLTDGSECVVKEFPIVNNTGKYTESYEVNRTIQDKFFVGKKTHRDAPTNYGDSGSAARFFYQAKPSSAERNAGLDGFEKKQIIDRNTFKSAEWNIDPRSPNGGYEVKHDTKQSNHHPTVKSIALMEYLIKLITPPGGTILDCFMGSGSTGCAAAKLGFEFIGIEKELEYFNIAKARIEFWKNYTEPEISGEGIEKTQNKIIQEKNQYKLF